MTIIEKINFEENWLAEVNLTTENVKIALAGIRATALEQQQEPCEDCISRQEVNTLVDELARAISDERCFMSRGRSTEFIMRDILVLPSVIPQPKIGHWARYVDNYKECSNCGKLIKYYYDYNYCPTCGARMEEDKDDERRSN